MCEVENTCASFSKYAEGRMPSEIIAGETPDISEYIDFEFYDWVSFRSNPGLGPVQLGRWLGVSHRFGRLMSYWIFPESGIPISATTVQQLTNAEQSTDEVRTRMCNYESKVKITLDAQSANITQTLRDVASWRVINPEDEDPEFFNEFTRVITDVALAHADSNAACEDSTKSIEVGSNRYVGISLLSREVMTVK